MRLLLLLPAVVACARHAPSVPGAATVAHPGSAGLSGLTVDPSGQLLAVGERPAVVVALDPQTRRALRTWPITGLPAGAEPESVAATASGALWIGTEARAAGRLEDTVVRVVLADEAAQVVEILSVPWATWGLSPDDNQGLEALCAVGEQLVVGGEPVRVDGDRRLAPLGWRTEDGWRAHWLPLSTATGKLSGLWCGAADDGGLRLTAIERHFGVLVLHTAVLAADAAPGSLVSAQARLPQPAALVEMGVNFEGVAVLRSALWLLTDNQGGGRVTDTWLVELPAQP